MEGGPDQPTSEAIEAAAKAAGLRDQPGGEAIDTVVLACPHFPLVARELVEVFGPGVRFVHGAEGIARRVAHLTEGQAFKRSEPDLALFTREEDGLVALRPALEHYGINRMEIL